MASVGGFLFRKRETRVYSAFQNAEISAAISTEVEPLWEINEDFFESQEEIAALAKTDKLWTVRVDGEIAGCGLSIELIEPAYAAIQT